MALAKEPAVPAKAGTHGLGAGAVDGWVPVFAGTANLFQVMEQHS
jgi:hypothetical protein